YLCICVSVYLCICVSVYLLFWQYLRGIYDTTVFM
ncbi:hypothetical protein AZZ84_000099, partial [Escherichia coli]